MFLPECSNTPEYYYLHNSSDIAAVEYPIWVFRALIVIIAQIVLVCLRVETKWPFNFPTTRLHDHSDASIGIFDTTGKRSGQHVHT